MKIDTLKHGGDDACQFAGEKPLDIAGYIIQCHGGNAKAAIKAMQDEIERLQRQLHLASAAMGRGFTRGWVPDEGDP